MDNSSSRHRSTFVVVGSVFTVGLDLEGRQCSREAVQRSIGDLGENGDVVDGMGSYHRVNSDIFCELRRRPVSEPDVSVRGFRAYQIQTVLDTL